MKIIFTIILLFFSFINVTFATDLTNLKPGDPCPPPYAPGDTSCHKKEESGPKIKLKEIVITDDKDKFVKYTNSSQQMPISFEYYDKEDGISYHYVNKFGHLILFYQSGSYCNYTTGVCYKNYNFNSFRFYGTSDYNNIYETKDFLFFVSQSEILIFDKEKEEFLNISSSNFYSFKSDNSLDYYNQVYKYNFFDIKNNILDIYFYNENLSFIKKFSFDLDKLKNQKKLFNSKDKYNLYYYLDGNNNINSSNVIKYGFVKNSISFESLKEKINKNDVIDINSIKVDIISRENTSIDIANYYKGYSKPEPLSKIYLFRNSSIYLGKGKTESEKGNFEVNRLVSVINQDGQRRTTNILGGSEDKILTDVKFVNLEYSNGYYYISYYVSNLARLKQFFPTLYYDEDGKKIPGVYTIYTKDLVNFSDAKILTGAYFLGYNNGVTIFGSDGIINLAKNGLSNFVNNYNFNMSTFEIFKDKGGDLRFGFHYSRDAKFYISGEPIINNQRKGQIEGGENFGKDFTKDVFNNKGDLGGVKDEKGDYVIETDEERKKRINNFKKEQEEERERIKKEIEELKSKEDVKNYLNKFFGKSAEKIQEFLNLFTLNFPSDYEKRAEIPYIKNVIENGKPKIIYGTVKSELKPIKDDLKINGIGETSSIVKYLGSLIFVFIYISVRVGLITLSLFFIFYIYKYINKIIDFLFGKNLDGNNNGNLASGFSFVFYIGIIISIFITFLGIFSVIQPFFNKCIDFLNLFVGFIVNNFFNFELFITTVNAFGTGITFGLLGYFIYLIILKFGKLF